MIETIRLLLDKQIAWHRQYDSFATRDQLLTRAERIVAEKLEHTANKAEALGENAYADMFDNMCSGLLPAIVQEMRSKR